ncbi:hypothetical protein JIN77_05500 [Verrucomicrobiaceae bacterium R5-34]|nr:hypothetical protein [Verrucomicrobiaceae bacterium R5-34]
MSLLELFEALKPYQKGIVVLLPIAGIVVGWVLKTCTDLLIKAKDDWAKRRECIFYLLQSWKNVLDYERYISHISKQDLEIEEYEEIRTGLSQKLGEQLAASRESLKTGIVSLASVDPTAAAQLDNTLKNFLGLLSYDFSELIEKDPAVYQAFNKEFYGQIDWTLSDMADQAEKLASKAGPFQKRRTNKWLDARIKGGAEFHDGVAEIQGDIERRRNEG